MGLRVAILSFYDFDEVQGGTEIFVRYLREAFPESEMITFAKCRSEVIGPSLVKVNLEYERMGLAISRGFARMNREKRFDLIFCNDVSGLALKLVAPQVPACQIFHYTYRGFAGGALRHRPGYASSYHVQPLFEKFTANSKKVVTVSHKTRRELEQLYGLSAEVIENGVPLDHFRPIPREEARERLGIKWDGPIGIFVGRTDSTKGFDIVKAVAAKRKDMRILCVTGSDLVEKGMITARKVPNEQMPFYYSSADFLFFPSFYESASYASIEALACGLPVVAYRTGLFEDIEEHRVGRFLTSRDPEDYSRAIDEVLGHGKYSSRQVAEERYSLDRFIADYRSLAQRSC
jgi:glycosyltransferase involved in cell wall biosynthesis